MPCATNEWLRGAWSGRPGASSARLTERVFHGFGMMGDDCQKNARWAVRLGSALLPVSYRCGGESEARRETGLAEAEFLAHGSNIDYGRAFDAQIGRASCRERG